jgi:hypothetical protein
MLVESLVSIWSVPVRSASPRGTVTSLLCLLNVSPMTRQCGWVYTTGPVAPSRSFFRRLHASGVRRAMKGIPGAPVARAPPAAREELGADAAADAGGRVRNQQASGCRKEAHGSRAEPPAQDDRGPERAAPDSLSSW